MADQQSGQEPDEFGTLPGGVSDLRSRFEQLSNSESSRPAYRQRASSSVNTRQKDLNATHTFGQAEKKLVMGHAAPPKPKKPASASPQSLPHDAQTTVPSNQPSSSSAKHTHAGPTMLSVADLAALSAPSSANTSTTDLGKSVSKDKPAPHSRQVSGSSRQLAVPASKFGEAAPGLLTPRSFDAREAASSLPASATASASTSDTEGPAKQKMAPPRPPKTTTHSHGIQILDEADLDRLANANSSSRVASLASMFGHHSHQRAASGTSTPGTNNLVPSRVATGGNHFLKYSRSNEQLSPTADPGSEPFNPFKQHPPVVPPRPFKADGSSESFSNLPGSIASVMMDSDTGSAPAIPTMGQDTSFVTPSPPDASSALPPQLPPRDPDALPPDHPSRRRLSASRSTGALPLLSAVLAEREPELPPLPTRRPSEAETGAIQNGPSIMPPPQRSAAASPSAAAVHRSHTVTARTKPIPVSSASARRAHPSHTLSPSQIDSASAFLPPPTRHAGINATGSIGRSLGSSLFGSNRPGSDSSDEEDDVEAASSVSPSSSFQAPAGLRRLHASADMTPTGLPDTSHANRRAPKFNPDCCTSAKQNFQCFAVCGHTVVTGTGDKVKVYRVGESATGVGEKLCTVGEHLSKEVKLTALEFRPPNHGCPPLPAVGKRAHGETADEGRYLWCGTKDGHLWELDIAEAQVVHSRQNVHSDPIQLLKRVGDKMLSMDEGGKISIWLPSSDPDPAVAGLRLSNQPITQRIALEKGSHACVVGQQLWVSTGSSAQRTSKDNAGSKGPRIRIYNPFADDKPFNAISKAVSIPAEMGEGVGMVTGGTVIPSRPHFVYFGHDSGHVSIWSRQTYECVGVRKLGAHGLTAVAGVVKYLWVATRAGTISVFDTESAPWRALKVWTAHKEPITAIKVDEHGIEKAGRLQVASGGLDAAVHLWDGTLSFDWIEAEKGKREAEFCSYRSIKTLSITFNMDAASPSDLETSAENMEVFGQMLRNACSVGSDSLPADRPPDIIVFGFQELIDLESKKLTAKSLLLGGGKRKANDLGDRVSRQYRAWYDKLIQIVRYAMPATCGYLLVQSESLVGLFTCVFVKQTEFKHVRELAISTVKTGMGGRYGNKGAVIARLVVQDTSIAFVNSHLAAGQKHVKQRNADVADILEYPTVFDDPHADPAAYIGGGDGSMILDHELVFFSGDLNYRIDHSRDTVLSALVAGKISPLLEQDQLRKELKHNPAFRLKDFSEPGIGFLPTYKYDRGSHEWDTSEKNRIPAWCDRILFKSQHKDRIRCLEYRRWECTISDHRPVTAVFEARIKSADQRRRREVEDELRGKWRGLERGLLETAVRWYADPQ
ncbi:Endonuclease/exonuclease/phosphatase [Pseudozyma hubeiensis]|nr:Endonuclease/exonuclease/phosphatase [Pseudozyma hubeiensis]